jgi:hypothetical protein
MIDEALEFSRRGGNIIFDVLNIDVLAKRLLTRHFNGPLRAILTYCPFHVLSSRMERRNKEALESGELGNQRNGAFPFLQFSDIYSQKEKEQDVLDTITREQAITAFDANFDKGVEADSIRGMKLPSLDELQLMKDKKRAGMLKKLGFKEDVDAVEIAPKNQDFYHFMVNISYQLPEESTQMIHEGTSLRYQKKVE